MSYEFAAAVGVDFTNSFYFCNELGKWFCELKH
jgi:hypothetical protein